MPRGRRPRAHAVAHAVAHVPVLAFGLAVALALAACDPSAPGPTADVAEVVVSPGRVLMTAHGDSRTLTATALDANGARIEGVEVTWSSSSAAIGSVTPAGVVTAVADGTALITATAGGETGAADLTVLGGADPPVVYGNGTVLTMDPVDRVEEAVIVFDGRVFATGPTADVAAMVGPEAIAVDLAGAAVAPGFVDPHNHSYNTIFLGSAPPELGTTYAEAEQRLIELGVTALANPGVWPSAMADFMAFVDADGVRLRTSIYPGYNDFCGNPWPDDWYLDYPLITDPAARFRIPGIKFFGDGGACNVAALSFRADGGDLYFNVADLAAAVGDVQARGYQAAIHALGDIAIDTVLAALEVALAGAPNAPRHRMEHNRYLRDRQLDRYSEVGAIPVVFAYPFTCEILDGGTWSFLDRPEYEPLRSRFDPWRALLDANPDLPIASKSDGPHFGPLAPMTNLWNLVTRDGIRPDGSLCDAPAWLEAGGVSPAEALEMMTINAAYAMGMDAVIGSLADGKLADLVVLDGDPLAVPHADIRTIAVRMTMIGGAAEYCAAGFEALCPQP